MCRTSRTHGENNTVTMSPSKNYSYSISYADRLDSLKRVLKPYRDNNANSLRSITRSARVNLNRHWKSLENLFAGGNRDRNVGLGECCQEERAQNATNEKLEDGGGENAVNVTTDTIEKLRTLRVDR